MTISNKCFVESYRCFEISHKCNLILFNDINGTLFKCDTAEQRCSDK